MYALCPSDGVTIETSGPSDTVAGLGALQLPQERDLCSRRVDPPQRAQHQAGRAVAVAVLAHEGIVEAPPRPHRAGAQPGHLAGRATIDRLQREVAAVLRDPVPITADPVVPDRRLLRERQLKGAIAVLDARPAEDDAAQLDGIATDQETAPVLAAPDRSAKRTIVELEANRRPYEGEICGRVVEHVRDNTCERLGNLLVRIREQHPVVLQRR